MKSQLDSITNISSSISEDKIKGNEKNINAKKYFMKLILTFNFSYKQKRKKQAREACLLFIREKLI